MIALNDQTSSQSETIYQAVKLGDITGSFFVKDCDNIFELNPEPVNSVSTIDLNSIGLIDAKNKSYVEVDSLGVVSNIVEKEVISSFFCCGGYSFKSSDDFCKYYEDIKSLEEVYISHVIYRMIMSNEEFVKKDASDYVDLGTVRDYRQFCDSFLTIFCDVDGVLLKNGSKFSKNAWKTKSIKNNVDILVKRQKKDNLFLVLTSSRPESEINQTIEELKSEGLRVDRCLFGLPHSKRYLINDYSPTNPYPSSIAINIERDSDKLENFLN